MDLSVDTIEIPIAPAPGRTKIAELPIDGPVFMGMHGSVAEHYGVAPSDFEPHATSLDYLVAAVGSCLTGTLSGMLNRLGQQTTAGQFSAIARGRLVVEQHVLRVAAIEMSYSLRLDDTADAAKVQRAHDRHQAHCPVAKSIAGSIAITTGLVLI